MDARRRDRSRCVNGDFEVRPWLLGSTDQSPGDENQGSNGCKEHEVVLERSIDLYSHVALDLVAIHRFSYAYSNPDVVQSCVQWCGHRRVGPEFWQ
jgi:hypothetical protein